MSHKRCAGMVLIILQATKPSLLLTYWAVPDSSRQTICLASFKSKLSSLTSFVVTGNDNGQSALFLTASINSLVINNDRLNWRKRPSSRFARINSMTSG